MIDDGPDTPPILSPSIKVNPGETAQVQVGGIGSPVTGKLVAPPDTEIRNWSHQVTMARLNAVALELARRLETGESKPAEQGMPLSSQPVFAESQTSRENRQMPRVSAAPRNG